MRPELLSRIDEILFFENLADADLSKIIQIELENIRDRLTCKKIKLLIHASVKKYIFNKIKSQDKNARNIKNSVKTLVQIPLSHFIIKNKNIEKISAKIVDKNLTLS